MRLTTLLPPAGDGSLLHDCGMFENGCGESRKPRPVLANADAESVGGKNVPRGSASYGEGLLRPARKELRHRHINVAHAEKEASAENGLQPREPLFLRHALSAECESVDGRLRRGAQRPDALGQIFDQRDYAHNDACHPATVSASASTAKDTPTMVVMKSNMANLFGHINFTILPRQVSIILRPRAVKGVYHTNTRFNYNFPQYKSRFMPLYS